MRTLLSALAVAVTALFVAPTVAATDPSPWPRPAAPTRPGLVLGDAAEVGCAFVPPITPLRRWVGGTLSA